MKKTKVILASVATVLVAGTTLFTSCEKETNEGTAFLQKTVIGNPCGDEPHVDGPFARGLTVDCPIDNLPSYCNYKVQGDCLREVTISTSSTLLDMVVSGGPSSVGEFFSGEEWKRFWPELDSETIATLASGEYYLHKMQRSENRCFYVATKSSTLEAGIEIYLVMPVIYE